jgi:hypothetical protein
MSVLFIVFSFFYFFYFINEKCVSASWPPHFLMRLLPFEMVFLQLTNPASRAAFMIIFFALVLEV